MNNVRKKTPEEFHIFVKFFAIMGIQIDPPTEFLPNFNLDANKWYNILNNLP